MSLGNSIFSVGFEMPDALTSALAFARSVVPADFELRYASALSVLSAFAAAEPPFAFTTFELTMPSDVLATSTGIAGFGVFDFMTTVYLPFADVVMPASRNDGLPFRLTSRLNENTTSADVSGVPSEKCTSLRSVNV